MSKFIGIKMIEANPMTAGEAIEKGYRIGNIDNYQTDGYEVTYPDGYKSWLFANVFEAAYFKLNDENGDRITKEDVDKFIIKEEAYTIADKNTCVVLTCKTGFQTIGTSGVVNKENYDINIGKQYARPKAEDGIWFGLGFILQWAKDAINNIDRTDEILPHIKRMMEEYSELKNKYNKLKSFINNRSIFNKLELDEQNDLEYQLDTMKEYINILNNRLTRIGYEPKN